MCVGVCVSYPLIADRVSKIADVKQHARVVCLKRLRYRIESSLRPRLACGLGILDEAATDVGACREISHLMRSQQ